MMAIVAADLFCGAGGTSTGLAEACARLDLPLDLLAVNHWNLAVETHSANHPGARHLCATLDAVDPRDHVPGGRLDLLVASPECTHHSTARGGRPMCNQSRASAWLILKWLQELYVDSVLIENVQEFRSWGPLGADGHPLRSKRGATFQAFLTAIESLGYNVDHRVLNAADYGDPTTRERLFIQARRKPRRITWPEATHSRDGQAELFEQRRPWRVAREIIDWSAPGQSIFRRKKPLAPATIYRIAAGLRKFGGEAAEPFLVMLYGTGNVRSMDEPMPTVTGGGQHIGICQPFVLGQQSGSVPRLVDEPVPTMAAAGAISLVEPFVLPMNRHKDRIRGVNEPMATVTATSSDLAIVQPFVLSMEHSGKPIDPFVIPTNHGKDSRTYPVDRPMPTITTVDAWAVIEPFLISYYGTDNISPVCNPVPTVTTKDRFGLVMTAHGPAYIDILFRMLMPRELARAQGFPDDYKFKGNREQVVKQIGNAVPRRLARALCLEILREQVRRAA